MLSLGSETTLSWCTDVDLAHINNLGYELRNCYKEVTSVGKSTHAYFDTEYEAMIKVQCELSEASFYQNYESSLL